MGAGSYKPVQERLLDSAERLFCERGFDKTGIRDLAREAGCNIAAVNYYFGGKEKLYVEVWRRNLRAMRDTRLASIERVMSQNGGPPCLEDLLRSFANAFIGPLIDESKGSRFIKLMAHEVIDRRLPGNIFFEELIKPTLGAFTAALLRICGDLEKSKVPLVIISFIGQLVQALHVQSMFEEIEYPELPRLDLPQMVEHIVQFSAAGIRACAGKESNDGR